MALFEVCVEIELCVRVAFFLQFQGKLLVGHNMFLDVLHTINRYRCALPDVTIYYRG